jgi:hypothetical protein
MVLVRRQVVIGLVACICVLAALWLVFVAILASRHQAICPATMFVASREEILKQGIWGHIQHRAVAELPSGLPGRRYAFDPSTPIDVERVSAFVRENHGCCSVIAPGLEPLDRLSFMIFSPSQMVVHVKRPPSRTWYNANYLVDVCWDGFGGR